MSKTQISISLSDLALSATAKADNRSSYINEILEAIAVNPTTIKYIESLTGHSIDYKKLVELGLEQLKVKADKQRDLQRLTVAMSQPKQQLKPNRNIAIKNAIGQCGTWDELKAALSDYNLTNIKGVNARGNMEYSSMQYYYEDKLVRNATNNQYSVNRQGNILEA